MATLSYGFDRPKRWLREEGQLFLDPLNPQSELSDWFLEAFATALEEEPELRARLERHYEMSKRHPLAQKDGGVGVGQTTFGNRRPVLRSGPKIGPNEPCPCGSGKKFKRCCRDAAVEPSAPGA